MSSCAGAHGTGAVSRRAAVTGLAAVASMLAVGRSGASDPAAPAAARLDRLVIAGMPATPTVLLARGIAAGTLAPHVAAPALKVWRTLDELRAGVRTGAYDLVALPTDAAASLFNAGAPIRLVGVLAWGLLFLIGRDPAVTGVEALAGRRVTVAFRGEAPDLILRLVLRRLGLDPDRDVVLDYVATPAETARKLLAGETDLAAVPEPVATAVLMRAAQSDRPMRRIADLTAVYGALTGRTRGLPKAGLAASEALLQARPELVAAVHAACGAAVDWVRADPAAAGRLGSEPLALPAAVVEASLPHFRLDVVTAAAARDDIERYYADLVGVAPNVLGGAPPPARFYWGGTG
ncbi:ABC transporter substrate-binding protein [Rhodoplanes sp. TEM]|uniref:ABC transporter substrate-binding protein n=1 Tax=Rhodoplanes tepidamans TaxID=200616 RepID=A0ABT5JGC9_RHOTP|nr:MULTISPECIES: ABC transporter substrate-binding protein [Rhodoplanes]MDC7788543.1 ABC transporter substrate-binding protein [Rhodoplanes tepidamans]MDC7985142.1 ABC transporter substrate-binding protein [Rhodoplanes sp. TEM]MDQ0353398.1 NitT/TauT family transport system substrate-binding protein [Rhodoplanes tepidamans]